MIEPSAAARAYSGLAASIVETSLVHVEQDFAHEHGAYRRQADCFGAWQAWLARDDSGFGSRSDPYHDFDPTRRIHWSTSLHAVHYYTRRSTAACLRPDRRTGGDGYMMSDMRLRLPAGKGTARDAYFEFRRLSI